MNQGFVSSQPTRHLVDAEREVLEGRVAFRLASALEDAARSLPHDISERLRVARERAVDHAKSVRRTEAAAAVVSVTAGGAARLGGPELPWGWRVLLSALPAIALLAGLVGVDAWQQGEQISAAAEMDAGILADVLPPEAYRDPGFVEFIEEPVGTVSTLATLR